MKAAENLRIDATPAGAVLSVKVVPGSSRNAVVGVLGDALKVATSAAPERGKANAAVCKLLADTLGLDAKAVEVIDGLASPRKRIRLSGLAPDDLRKRLKAL